MLDSVGLVWGLRLCISNKFPGAAVRDLHGNGTISVCIRNWLCDLAGAGKSEICEGRKLRQDFSVIVLRQNCFLFPETSSFALKPSPDWMKLAHIIQTDIFYLKPADFRC